MLTDEEIKNASKAQTKIGLGFDFKKEYAFDEGFEKGAKWARDKCNEWISVEDKLPDNEERVAILYRYKDGPNLRTFIGEYDPIGEKWHAALNDIKVEFWMPLPEPPK